MTYSRFSTLNADYYHVHTHHGDVSEQDFPVVGRIFRLFADFEGMRKKNYPTMEEIFEKDKIKNLDAIVFENHQPTGKEPPSSTGQYEHIMKNLLESKAKTPLYFMDVSVKADDTKVHYVVGAFGLTFLLTAGALGTYAGVRKLKDAGTSRAAQIIKAEIEEHENTVGKLREIRDEMSKRAEESRHDESCLTDARENALFGARVAEEEIARSEEHHSKRLEQIRKNHRKAYDIAVSDENSNEKPRMFTRRRFLATLGLGSAYGIMGAYFLAGHLYWPYRLGFRSGEADSLSRKMIYLQTELFPTTTVNLRNAIWAKKLEETVAPHLMKKLGRRPRIAVLSGVMHAGLEEYAKDREKRERIIDRYAAEILNADREDLEKVLELRPEYRGSYVVWKPEILNSWQ